MGLNDTPSSERLHIGIFGCRNAGKSSIVNALTAQKLSVVSNVPGTTTDPVQKAMELLPLGPVMIIDTPGFDDVGELGEKRVETTKRVLRKCHVAVLVTDATKELNQVEKHLIHLFDQNNIPYILVKNKCDLLENVPKSTNSVIFTCATNKIGINELKNAIGNITHTDDTRLKIVGDLIKKDDFVVLVTPIDSAAPKGRMILPQQQAIRDVLEASATCIVVKESELENALKNLGKTPSLVVTDSQAFAKVMKIVPNQIPLTSFSILMARYKGFLKTAYDGAVAIEKLSNNSKVLISEGCTHHRQCDDIGTVKLPKWLKEYTKKDLIFEFSSGGTFPDDLSGYDLVIHCGGCMLNSKELNYRMRSAENQNVPFTNYGIAIAYINNILHRSTKMLPEFKDMQ